MDYPPASMTKRIFFATLLLSNGFSEKTSRSCHACQNCCAVLSEYRLNQNLICIAIFIIVSLHCKRRQGGERKLTQAISNTSTNCMFELEEYAILDFHSQNFRLVYTRH